ncbi:transposase [Streptomyces avidinii]|uniref:transposase n=1 Tax=Streptomyces avidinii TaxID=1895 RepID=UPI00386CA509|nr:transposase [Streptomyces avidinii]
MVAGTILKSRSKTRLWRSAAAIARRVGSSAAACASSKTFRGHSETVAPRRCGFCLFLYLDGMSVPVDWRLALPEAWVTDPVLRRRARIAPEAVHQSPEALVLELADSIAARTSSARPPVVADLGRLGGAAALIGMLGRRGHDFLVSVPPTLAVRAAGLTPGSDGARTPGRGTTAADFARLGNTSHPYTAPLAGPGARPQGQRIHSALVRVPEGESGARGAQQI